MEMLVICGTGAFFLVGAVADFFSTCNTRSVASDDCTSAIIMAVLVEVCRWGAFGVAVLFPGDLSAKTAFAIAYIAGVALGVYLGMRGIRSLVQRGKALVQW